MGQLRPLLWASSSAHDKSQRATCERLQNCFYEKNPPGSITPWKVVGRPGLKYFTTLGAGPVRGSCVLNGRLLVVSGASIYVVNMDGSSYVLGTVPGSGHVPMVADDSAGGGVGQFFLATNVGSFYGTLLMMAQVDSNWYSSVTEQDGYAIAALGATNRFYVSDPDDFSTWQALAYTSADAYNGTALAAVSCNEILTLFGQNFLSAYGDSGNPLFPFTRIGGGVIQIGCGAALSPTRVQDQIGFVATDWSVQTYQPGGSHQPISTPGIEAWIKARLKPYAAEGMSYRQGGHHFYVLNFPGEGTIAYDYSTQVWHDLNSWQEPDWTVGNYIQAYGMDLVGDSSTGNLYILDPETNNDSIASAPGGGNNFRPIGRIMQPPPVHGDGNRGIMDEVRLDCEMGGAPNGSHPSFGLEYSDDDGRTWSNKLFRSAGDVGNYGWGCRWNRLGQFRRRTLRFSLTDPIKLAALGAYWRGDICDG